MSAMDGPGPREPVLAKRCKKLHHNALFSPCSDLVSVLLVVSTFHSIGGFDLSGLHSDEWLSYLGTKQSIEITIGNQLRSLRYEYILR
jgi:hypothetical protein